MSRIREMIRKHEGLRLKMYFDSVGVPTIGYGRNLKDVGVSKEEANILLSNDIQRAKNAARAAVRSFERLSEARQDVLVDMAFNLGLGGLVTFRKFLDALDKHEYRQAASEMLDSKWARQVGRRAQELAQIMRVGVHPESDVDYR